MLCLIPKKKNSIYTISLLPTNEITIHTLCKHEIQHVPLPLSQSKAVRSERAEIPFCIWRNIFAVRGAFLKGNLIKILYRFACMLQRTFIIKWRQCMRCASVFLFAVHFSLAVCSNADGAAWWPCLCKIGIQLHASE